MNIYSPNNLNSSRSSSSGISKLLGTGSTKEKHQTPGLELHPTTNCYLAFQFHPRSNQLQSDP
eukprot:scaffold9546_cov19-Tisochrysis_lutea.AAC.2